jgi:hypothetical protein
LDEKSVKWPDFDGFLKFQLFFHVWNHGSWFPVHNIRPLTVWPPALGRHCEIGGKINVLGVRLD